MNLHVTIFPVQLYLPTNYAILCKIPRYDLEPYWEDDQKDREYGDADVEDENGKEKAKEGRGPEKVFKNATIFIKRTKEGRDSVDKVFMNKTLYKLRLLW